MMQPINRLLALVRGRFALPLSCLGVGLISTWSELSFINPPVARAAAPEMAFQLFNMGTVLLAAGIAVGLRAGFVRGALVARNRNLVVTALLLLAATVMNFVTMAFVGTTPWLSLVSAVVGGVGLALLFIMWFEVISHLTPVQLLSCYALAAIGRVALIWLCSGMQEDRLFASLCTAVVVSVALLKRTRDTVAEEAPVIADRALETKGAGPTEGACSFPLRPLLVVLTGTLTLSFAMRIVDGAWGTNGNPGVLVAGVLVVAAILAKGDAFEFKWLWQGSLVFMVAFIVVFASGGMTAAFLPAFLVCISYELCLMLMYSILGNLVYRNFYNSTFLYSVEIAIALTSGTVGGMLCDGIERLYPAGPTLMLAMASALFAILFAASAVYAFSERNLSGKWSNIIRKPIAHDTDLLLERTRLGRRCHELAEEAGLSSREEEVLLLMAQRKKPAAIASQLVIEVSTVNTHKKHIYRKLDVHSAKELQARLGSAAQ